MENEHTTSTLLNCAGAMMALSGILMAVCAGFTYGGILWAAASCLFFASYQFRLAENKNNEAEESEEE